MKIILAWGQTVGAKNANSDRNFHLTKIFTKNIIRMQESPQMLKGLIIRTMIFNNNFNTFL